MERLCPVQKIASGTNQAILWLSVFFEKAVCLEKPAEKVMVAKGTIELLTQGHVIPLQTIFFLLLPHGKESR